MKIVYNLVIKTILKVRFLIYSALFFVDSVLKFKTKVIILSYHSIANDAWNFSVSLVDFKRQIEYLKKTYNFITLEDIYSYLKGRKIVSVPSVVLTFDDGYSDLYIVRNYLEKMNIQPTLFMLSDREKADRKAMGNRKTLLTNTQIQNIHEDGWIIGCHSGTHTDLDKLSSFELDREIKGAKKKLTKELGIPIRYFAYPNGFYSEAIIAKVKKAGFLLGLSMDDGFINSNSNPYTLARIGIVRSHSFREFQAVISPSVILCKKLLEKTFLGNCLYKICK